VAMNLPIEYETSSRRRSSTSLRLSGEVVLLNRGSEGGKEEGNDPEAECHDRQSGVVVQRDS